MTNPNLLNFRKLFFLATCYLLLGTLGSGCIRLTGNAGYWKQGAEDEASEAKSVGFDTQKMMPGYTPGDIQVADER